MPKAYFVLTELKDFCDYPALVRIKDYTSQKGQTPQNTVAIAKSLENQGYKRVESTTNVILIEPSLK